MFVLLLIEICRSLFDDLHLNSDDEEEDSSVTRAMRHRRRAQIYSAGSVYL